ncbi:hypothetical protein [Saccharopolyspora sp. NPDC002686]|uniref:hypothetical protein n=1 Tax=Saccharopolyspora sp. NPDC002686 TaxID=3154541 RepID=UPI003329A5B0
MSGNEPESAMDEYDAEAPMGLKELLGLPDRLPPLRLPSDEELAVAARQSTLLDRLRQLALRAVERPGAEWAAADVIAAAEALGVRVPDSVEELDDIPDLACLWALAVDAGFFDPAHPDVPGPALEEWPDGGVEEVLDTWSDVLGLIVEGGFHGESGDLDLEDVGVFAMTMLFMARNDGMPIAELRSMIADLADAEPDAWDAWVGTSGDPADRLLAMLTDLGAALVDGGIARLTPLGQYAFAGALTASGVEVPLLPPVEETTAEELVEFAKGVGDAELEAELAAWIASRTPEEALDALLTAAAAGAVEDRMIAVTIAKTIEGEQRWRQALDEPVLRPYAKMVFQELSGDEPEYELTAAEAAWLLTDLLSTASDAADPDEIPALLAESVPAGQEVEIFEQIWRLDHPHAREVLELIGRTHPEKRIAKAARKAALKVQSR